MMPFVRSALLLLHTLFKLNTATVTQPFHRQTIEGIPPILFQGILLNDLQNPIANAQIQFWQTDPQGLYNHPNAANSDSLDETFQYCGTATTLQDGSFWFLTHRPGIYTGRPTHFHYKVWIDGRDVLTSQFYFADENTRYSDMQVIELQDRQMDNGMMGFVTKKTIVLDMGLGGEGPFTPSDMEGPFYPVFDFFGYGNDLISSSDSDGGGVLSGAPTPSPSIHPFVVVANTSSPSVTIAPTMEMISDNQNLNSSYDNVTTAAPEPSVLYPPITTYSDASPNITFIMNEEQLVSSADLDESSPVTPRNGQIKTLCTEFLIVLVPIIYSWLFNM